MTIWAHVPRVRSDNPDADEHMQGLEKDLDTLTNLRYEIGDECRNTVTSLIYASANAELSLALDYLNKVDTVKNYAFELISQQN